MPSEVGQVIADARKRRGIGLRALARKVGRSPSFLAMIEKSDPPPGMGEETLQRIAIELDLDPDVVLTLAGKTPEDVVPADATEVAIYRLVKALSPEQKQSLLLQLRGDTS